MLYCVQLYVDNFLKENMKILLWYSTLGNSTLG